MSTHYREFKNQRKIVVLFNFLRTRRFATVFYLSAFNLQVVPNFFKQNIRKIPLEYWGKYGIKYQGLLTSCIICLCCCKNFALFLNLGHLENNANLIIILKWAFKSSLKVKMRTACSRKQLFLTEPNLNSPTLKLLTLLENISVNNF